MTPDTHFGAPWSPSLKVGSTLATLAIGCAAVLTPALSPTPRWVPVVVPVTVVLLLGICALFTVRGYIIEPDTLLVRRLFWNTQVPLRQLEAAEARPPGKEFYVRLFGNGGLFSFSGWYWCRTLGRFRLFGTDMRRSVVLRLGNRVVVVTPDRPDEFVSRLLERRGLTPP